MRQLYSERGFVLLMVMVLMQIILLLATHAASTLKAGQTNNRLSRLNAENRIKALSVLEKLPKQAMTFCSGQRYSPFFLSTRPEAWWRVNACMGHDGRNEYYYIQEPLREGVCDKGNSPVKFVRNTLFYMPDIDSYSAMIWQETVAVLSTSGECLEIHDVKLGRLMVRQLR